NLLFCTAGIGWASINVNSFPMGVELCNSDNVGKYTGYYYTASMAAQTLTPFLSGFFMDKIGMTSLFPYASICIFCALITMIFVRRGDNREVLPPVDQTEETV
ncbi:MAG: MFS transporter, partial [Clostridia bacterium]|nr:MFS transporter [Clostridia bacterium]